VMHKTCSACPPPYAYGLICVRAATLAHCPHFHAA
jgi:hypothetical protein